MSFHPYQSLFQHHSLCLLIFESQGPVLLTEKHLIYSIPQSNIFWSFKRFERRKFCYTHSFQKFIGQEIFPLKIYSLVWRVSLARIFSKNECIRYNDETIKNSILYI